MTIATSATGSPSVAAPPSVARATRPHLASHLGAIAQLAAAGLVGSLLFGALATLLSLGVSLLLVLGIGILFLLAFLYLLWATSWLEHERVEGLYGFGVPTLRAQLSGVPGFGGWMRTLWQQFIDGQMWRGVASAAIATVLGLVVLPTVAGLVASVGLAFAPLGAADTVRVPGTGFQIEDGWAVGLGVLGVVISLAVLLGVALLHAVITRAILVPSQEAQFAAQAQVAGAQRAGAVRASEVERTRIERDLHDGVQPRLVSVAMTLGLAQQKIDDDPAAAKALVDEAHTSTKAAITELRQLAAASTPLSWTIVGWMPRSARSRPAPPSRCSSTCALRDAAARRPRPPCTSRSRSR